MCASTTSEAAPGPPEDVTADGSLEKTFAAGSVALMLGTRKRATRRHAEARMGRFERGQLQSITEVIGCMVDPDPEPELSSRAGGEPRKVCVTPAHKIPSIFRMFH